MSALRRIASRLVTPCHAALLSVLALALGGCAPESSFVGAEIECIGMTYGQPGAGYSRVATRFGARCNWLVSGTIFNDTPAIATAENLGDDNTIAMTFRTRGRLWTARSGDIRITRNEGNLMAGTYEVIATDGAGNELPIRGPFDFCAYGNRTDCPHQSAGGLTNRLAVSGPQGLEAAFDATYTSECRVLIDRASGGMQVDFQLGVYNGINIAHWVDQCEVLAAPFDRFTFRSGGVTGPGHYGPYTTQSLPHPDGSMVTLPALHFVVPLHYLGRSTACLTDLGRLLEISSAPALTSCSWTVEEDPGRFRLSCTDIRHHIPGRSVLPETGTLELDAECDVRYRE